MKKARVYFRNSGLSVEQVRNKVGVHMERSLLENCTQLKTEPAPSGFFTYELVFSDSADSAAISQVSDS